MSVLTKIVHKAKALRRAHPHKHDKKKHPWRAYMKEASEKVKKGSHSGKPRKKRKKRAVSKARKVGKVKRHRAAPKTRTVTKYKVRHVVRHKVVRVGRASGGGGMKNIMPIVALGAVAVAAYLLLKPKTPTYGQYPPLNMTGNTYRDTTAQNILAYATAAGLAADAVSKLINSLNNASDSQVNQIQNSIESGQGVPSAYLY